MTINHNILFYTDFNCPFCYALNERLSAFGDKSRIEWRGIEHDPSVSSKDTSLVTTDKLVNQVNVIRKRAQDVEIITPLFRPNTNLANRVVHLLDGQDKIRIADCRQAIYRALWLDGKDISEQKVLTDIVISCGLTMPSQEDIDQPNEDLVSWQSQWTGERFKSRLPVLLVIDTDKPLLGFPTHELLQFYFNGIDLPVAPESLAACQLKPKQNILAVGDLSEQRCNMVELEAPFDIVRKIEIKDAQAWLAQQTCCPDVILLDYFSLGQSSIQFCNELKKNANWCHIAVIFLLPELDPMLEMEAFDVGASDVYFDLSNPKVCQARFDAQLRQKQTSTLLDALARVDHLTELANRGEFDRKFEEQWYQAVRSGLPISVALFDIDFFKYYNDHYGHQLGDDCLRQTAKAMNSRVVRKTDFLARYGGEEFVVILSHTNEQTAFEIADEIRARVEAMKLPHAKSTVNDFVTLSGGVATIMPSKNTNPGTLLALADKALYQAKAKGRNRICH